MARLVLPLFLLMAFLSPMILAFSRRHDYRHAIKKPIIFGEGLLPHYGVYGDVMSSHEYLRIAPSVQSKKGAVWGEQAVGYANWELVMSFSLTGRGRLGGDGMALWLTKERLGEGEAMGAQEQWDGLMLFFDTYDNDGRRNNPYVGAILNDGSLRYSPDTDGSDLLFNGCQRNFRNTPVPVFVRVTYYQGTLSVAMDISSRGKNFVSCFEQEGIQIPQGYYFGITAATGGLADDHDLLSFELYELDPPPKKSPENTPTSQEKEMDQEQFEKIQEMVQEIRAKQDLFQVDDTYNFFMEKISNMEELLTGLAQITNTQEQIRQAANNALSLIEGLYSKMPVANPQAPLPNSQNNHHNQNNLNQPPLVPVMNKLNELQVELRKLAGKPPAHDPTTSLVTSVTSIESSLRQIESRLARLESSQSGGNNNQILQIIREELSRGNTNPKLTFKKNKYEEASSNNLLILLAVLLLAAVGGGAFYVATRKSSSKKFI